MAGATPWTNYHVSARGCDASVTLRQKYTFLEVFEAPLPILRRCSSQPCSIQMPANTSTYPFKDLVTSQFSIKEACKQELCFNPSLSMQQTKNQKHSKKLDELNEASEATDDQDSDTTAPLSSEVLEVPSDSSNGRMQGVDFESIVGMDFNVDDSMSTFSTRNKVRPCKGKRERYRKLVSRLLEEYASNPEAFDIGTVDLPPAVSANAWLVQKLNKRMQTELQKNGTQPRSQPALVESDSKDLHNGLTETGILALCQPVKHRRRKKFADSRKWGTHKARRAVPYF
mmetsp:Transcript_123214/g.223964  ORF Transcript_123214/g.223964 Transcript_123214/m.223964 type:complete len:285 (-) Transcript_123214:3-857(-)